MGEFWTGPVKSLTLEEILAERPSLVMRMLRWAKLGLMVWGGLSIAVAGGTAAYYIGRDTEQSVLVSDGARPAPERAPAPRPDYVALADMHAPQIDQTGTFSSSAAVTPAIEARLPKPRPDEPVVTGSIPGPDAYPYVRPRRAYPDACHTLRRIGAPFRLRVRCETQARYEPRRAPPRRVYYEPVPGY